MDPLTWLGLRPRDDHPRLTAIEAAVRELLPSHEPVVHRYVVVVSMLLTRVAQADGIFLQCEQDHLTRLFGHLEGMSDGAADLLCAALNTHAAMVDDAELALCYRELRALCDSSERLRIMQLLASIARADGTIHVSEHATMLDVARALGIPEAALASIEREPHESEHDPDEA